MPPVGITLMFAVFSPAQIGCWVFILANIALGQVSTTLLMVSWQPLRSVTLKVYAPWLRFLNILGSDTLLLN